MAYPLCERPIHCAKRKVYPLCKRKGISTLQNSESRCCTNPPFLSSSMKISTILSSKRGNFQKPHIYEVCGFLARNACIYSVWVSFKVGLLIFVEYLICGVLSRNPYVSYVGFLIFVDICICGLLDMCKGPTYIYVRALRIYM